MPPLTYSVPLSFLLVISVYLRLTLTLPLSFFLPSFLPFQSSLAVTEDI